MRARKRPVFLELWKVLICALRAKHCIVYSWVQKHTGLFREGTDHATLVNYRKVMKTCARAKDQCFLGPKGSCACSLGLPKVLKQSAMGQ